jgi:protoheme IX farnesyltransferase
MNLIDVPAVPLTICPVAEPETVAVAPAASWVTDWNRLAKPRISLMVLLTVAIGFLLAAGTAPQWIPLVHTLIGCFLAATAASILNQVLERDTDAKMERTKSRPLVTGRVSVPTALSVGILLACVGLSYLALAVNLVTAAVTAAIFFSYVFVYTPLKRRTAWNTFIGAIPGALPPVIGFAACTGTIPPAAWTLFAVLFVWQFPHFWAIAWLYREDYAKAGLVMLPNIDTEEGGLTGRMMFKTGLLLLAASLLPVLAGLAGRTYCLAAVALGLGFLAFIVRFWRQPSRRHARLTLWASLVYLPLVLLLVLADRSF